MSHWQTLGQFPGETNLSSYWFLHQHFPAVCMFTLPQCVEGRWSVLIHHPNPASLHFSSADHLGYLKCVTEQRKPRWVLWETGLEQNQKYSGKERGQSNSICQLPASTKLYCHLLGTYLGFIRVTWKSPIDRVSLISLVAVHALITAALVTGFLNIFQWM